MTEKKVLKVFVSSPGDVKAERQAVKRVAASINPRPYANNCHLECYLYEESVPPVAGLSAQSVVDNYMLRPEEADIFVCFLWSRLGTPFVDENGEEYKSGTEYEFLHAYKSYKSHHSPIILLYRCIRPIPYEADFEQAQKVKEFFSSFWGDQRLYDGLVKDFDDEGQFEKILLEDLLHVLHQHFTPKIVELSTKQEIRVDEALPASKEVLRVQCHTINAELRNYPTHLAGRHEISRSETTKIIEWIVSNADEKRLGILIDKPGSGKTVVMAQVLKELERRNITVLALKADYLSGVRSVTELQERLDLPVPLETCIRELAEEEYIVVLIDQLDALSVALSQDFATLDLIYSMLLKLLKIDRVRVVVSCREFDLHFDPKLSSLTQQLYTTFTLSLLTQEQIESAIRALGLEGHFTISDKLLQLLSVPLYLSLFVRLLETQNPAKPLEGIHTLHQLYDHLWDRDITPASAPYVSEAIDVLVDTMQHTNQLTAPIGLLDQEPYRRAAIHLQRVDFIRKEKRQYVFFHQTLFDYCYARRFVAQGRSISHVIGASAQGLFERAQMVQVLAYMRAATPTTYFQEIEALLFSVSVRVHLRLLLIEWFASIPDPMPDEQRLAKHLVQHSTDRYDFLRAAHGNIGWFDVLNSEGLSLLLAEEDRDQLKTVTVSYLESMINYRTQEVLALLAPYQGRNSNWDTVILRCLTALQNWGRNDE